MCAQKINFRKGSDAERLTITPSDGEPIWADKKFYIGDGTTVGGNLISGGSSSSSGYKKETIHVGGTDLAILSSHNDAEIHLEGIGNLTINANDIIDDTFGFHIVNTDAGEDRNLFMSNFAGSFMRDGTMTSISELTIAHDESYIVTVTNSGGSKYLNVFPMFSQTLVEKQLRGKQSTVHIGASNLAIAQSHNDSEIHFESTGNATINATHILTDTFLVRLTNTDSGVNKTLTPTGFAGAFVRDGTSNTITTSLTIKPNESYIISITDNGGKFLNAYPTHKVLNKIETGSWVPTITFTSVDPDISGATTELYKAIYTRIDDKVNFNLSFGLSNFTAGRYLMGSYTLPKTKVGTDSIISVANSTFASQYVPIYALVFFGTPSVFIGTPDIRLPAPSLITINIIGSYVTNES